MNYYPFSKEIIKKALQFNRPFLIEEIEGEQDCIEEVLDESYLFFCNFDNCGTRLYLSKSYFFNESEFTIHLTSYEVTNKVLVAPVRFLPFTQKTLPLTVEDKKVKTVKRKFPVSCLEKVYSLDHGQSLIKALNERSSTTLLNLNSLAGLELEAYDLSGFELKPGDHLLIRISGDSLRAKIINSEEIDFGKAQNWCESFEKCLISVLREFGPFTDLYSQIELAYFYGDKLLRHESSLALRDFLSLSGKVKMTDFVFRQIIWFSEADPVNSAEAMKKLSIVRNNFAGSPEVNGSFFALLDEKLKKEFTADQECTVPAGVMNLDFFSSLKRTVRRVALWIQNNKQIVADPEMPQHEILMFEAAFFEFQFLCEYFLESKNLKNCELNFEEALKLNFEILQELMAFLSEYYLSE